MRLSTMLMVAGGLAVATGVWTADKQVNLYNETLTRQAKESKVISTYKKLVDARIHSNYDFGFPAYEHVKKFEQEHPNEIRKLDEELKPYNDSLLNSLYLIGAGITFVGMGMVGSKYSPDYSPKGNKSK